MNRQEDKQPLTAPSAEPSEADDSRSFWQELYAVFYVAGVQTIRTLRAIARFTRLMWLPVAHGVRAAILSLKHPSSFADRHYTVDGASEEAGYTDGGRRLPIVQKLLLWPHIALRRSKRLVVGALNVVAPLAAAVVLLMTVNFWRQAEFGLSLKYQGETIGYVAGEGVYAQAVQLINGTVINSDGSFSVEKFPMLTVSLLKDEQVLTEQELCDRILASHSESLTWCAGLYVDGMFRGALSSAKDIQVMLNRILKEHESDKYDEVDFFNKVEILEGLYPNSALITETTMANRLTTLKVMTIKNITYTETVKYSTIRELSEKF